MTRHKTSSYPLFLPAPPQTHLCWRFRIVPLVGILGCCCLGGVNDIKMRILRTVVPEGGEIADDRVQKVALVALVWMQRAVDTIVAKDIEFLLRFAKVWMILQSNDQKVPVHVRLAGKQLIARQLRLVPPAAFRLNGLKGRVHTMFLGTLSFEVKHFAYGPGARRASVRGV